MTTMNTDKGWRARMGWRALVVPLLCLAVSVVSASTGGPITGHNGTLTTFLFDSDDISDLSEWSGYDLVVGSSNWYAGKATLAADAAGTVYTIVRGDNPDDFYDAVVGVVAGDGTALDTVYYNPYDGSGDWDMVNALALSPFSVGSGSARIDAGDVVLLSSTLRDYGEETERYGLLIQAFDPEDAAGTIRDLYYTEDASPGGFIFLDASTNSIVLPWGNRFERIAYDAGSGEWALTTVSFDSDASLNNGSVWAMDGNGDFYTDWKDYSSGSRDYRIKKIDGSTGELVTATYADPTGAPKSYGNHKIGGFSFDSNGKMWLADWKKSKSPSHFIAKRKNNGKFSYKKRIAGWEDSSNRDMKTLHCGADGVLYAIMRDQGAGTYAVWSID